MFLLFVGLVPGSIDNQQCNNTDYMTNNMLRDFKYSKLLALIDVVIKEMIIWMYNILQ